ncbi:MAG: Kelch repeat-containing protein [Myxococcales bacterium]
MAVVSGQDGRIYALGGYAGSITGAAEVLDIDAGVWTELPPLPTPRAWLTAATGSDGRIYVCGGQALAPDGGATDVATVEVLDPATNLWATARPMPEVREAAASVAGPDGKIYVVGGESYAGLAGATPATIYQSVRVFDPVADQWASAPDLPTARFALSAAIGRDGLLYAVGGGGAAGVLNTVETYNFTNGTWQNHGLDQMPTARYGLASVEQGGLLFAIGGAFNGPLNGILNTVEYYDPLVNQWE